MFWLAQLHGVNLVVGSPPSGGCGSSPTSFGVSSSVYSLAYTDKLGGSPFIALVIFWETPTRANLVRSEVI